MGATCGWRGGKIIAALSRRQTPAWNGSTRDPYDRGVRSHHGELWAAITNGVFEDKSQRGRSAYEQILELILEPSIAARVRADFEFVRPATSHAIHLGTYLEP